MNFLSRIFFGKPEAQATVVDATAEVAQAVVVDTVPTAVAVPIRQTDIPSKKQCFRRSSNLFRTSRRDLAEEPVRASSSVSSTREKATATDSLVEEPSLVLRTTPAFKQISTSAGSLYVSVSLKFEELKTVADSGDKLPLDLVCILDNSGSMGGEKIESLKNAMKFVIRSLGSNDRLSIVSFNHCADGLHGLTLMSPANKEKSCKLLDQELITGGNNAVITT